MCIKRFFNFVIDFSELDNLARHQQNRQSKTRIQDWTEKYFNEAPIKNNPVKNTINFRQQHYFERKSRCSLSK